MGHPIVRSSNILPNLVEAARADLQLEERALESRPIIQHLQANIEMGTYNRNQLV